jgi:hypothetical protein
MKRKKLYRFFNLTGGDEATTLAFVMAKNDEEAMALGFSALPEEALAGYSKAFGIENDEENEDGSFYTVEAVGDRLFLAGTFGDQVEDAEYLLSNTVGLRKLPDAVLHQMAIGLVNGLTDELLALEGR